MRKTKKQYFSNPEFSKVGDSKKFLKTVKNFFSKHCVKSVRMRSYSGSHFHAFGLNTERYEVSLRIQSECGKIRTTITPNTDTFHAVENSNNFETIFLVENNMVTSDDQKITDTFIEYFDIIVTKLGLPIPKDAIVATNGIEDPVLNAVHKYQEHPSMLTIKERYKDLRIKSFRLQ